MSFQPLLASDFYGLGLIMLAMACIAPCMVLVLVSLVVALVPAFRRSIVPQTTFTLWVIAVVGAMVTSNRLLYGRDSTGEGMRFAAVFLGLIFATWLLRRLGVALLKRAEARPDAAFSDGDGFRSVVITVSVVLFALVAGLVWRGFQ